VQICLGLKHVHDRKILHRWEVWGGGRGMQCSDSDHPHSVARFFGGVLAAASHVAAGVAARATPAAAHTPGRPGAGLARPLARAAADGGRGLPVFA
jgi:hypothetical protein